jgi:large repetitive protein
MIAILLSIVIAQAAAGTGEIRGRVTDRETGRPLARAIVHVLRPDGSGSFTAVTSEGGTFRFASVPVGRYIGFATARQHLTQDLASAPQGSRTLTLNKDDILTVNAALGRSYALSVRVVDQFGDPLSGMRLSVMPMGSARPMPIGMLHMTDDLGRTRLSGLAPGRYTVCADGGAGVGQGGQPVRRERLLRTCNPDPVVIERADVEDLEIKVRRGRTFTVSGVVTDASGAAPADAMIMFTTFETNGTSSGGVRVGVDGRFQVSDVPPGMYAIEASIGGANHPQQRRPLERGFVPVSLADADVENLVVAMEKTIDVKGRVALEDPNIPLPRPPGSGLIISTRLADERLPGQGSDLSAIMRPDHTFTLEGMFGRRVFDTFNVPSGWYVKTIRYGSKEVIDDAVEFKDTDQALDVVLSNRGAVVTGTVVDDAGAPVPRAQIYLFRPASSTAMPESTRASANGTFTLGPVRDGEYTIVAVPRETPWLDLGDWDRLARLSSAGERVTLGELDVRTIQLRVTDKR